jgi:hypothetical protein
MPLTITVKLTGGTSDADPVLLELDCKPDNPTPGENCMGNAIRTSIIAGLAVLEHNNKVDIVAIGKDKQSN